MNENFSDISLGVVEAQEHKEKIEGVIKNLDIFLESFGSSWNSSSSDNLQDSIIKEIEKLNNIIRRLNVLESIITLINNHNEKRELREKKKDKISSLKPRLYKEETHTTTKYYPDGSSKEKKYTVIVIDKDVERRINQLEDEIEEINRELDKYISNINELTNA